jgi:hypothetical protein
MAVSVRVRARYKDAERPKVAEIRKLSDEPVTSRCAEAYYRQNVPELLHGDTNEFGRRILISTCLRLSSLALSVLRHRPPNDSDTP